MDESREIGGKTKKHIIGIMVDDHPGVMSKLSSLFARRGFNIDSIVVGKSAHPGMAHIVISVVANDEIIEQLEKQVNKLIDVAKITDLAPAQSVIREHCLVKVASTEKSREDIINIAKIHKAKVLDINHSSIIVEIVGRPAKIENFIELMGKYGIKEVSRTGINALQRGTK